jgi:hypothetical protein
MAAFCNNCLDSRVDIQPAEGVTRTDPAGSRMNASLLTLAAFA